MSSLLKKILVFVVACALALTSLAGCSSTGKAAIELGDSEITLNMYMLLLSRMKGTVASINGTAALKDSYWDTVIDASAGKTQNDYYCDMVLESAKTYVAALHLFDELGLKLPASYIESIDEEIAELIEYDADGSKTAFNSILADYGANVKVLREAYIMEAKIAYLNDHLFGADGSKISADLYEDYYEDNYVRFRHIFFFTTKPVYDTDINGDVVYYTKDGKIAYDKTAVKKEENGAVVKDKNGDIVFVEQDGSVAYDKKNGSPNPMLDSKGNVMTTKLDTKELIALSDLIAEKITPYATDGSYTMFDSLVETYGEDEGMNTYPNGYYLTRTSDYDAPQVVEALFDMEEGEVRRIESDYGIHIVMKYPLEEGGYALEENADFFRGENGGFAFLTPLKSLLLSEYIAKYSDSITVDEELLKTVSMKTVGANYNY